MIPTPYYIIEERLLRRNLELISRVAEESGAEVILAFKAFALWKTFPIFREYIKHTTASSLYEARLAYEEFGSPAHTYSPAYKADEFPALLACSSHITFNSLTQYATHWPAVQAFKDHPVSCGLRVNPEYSEIETALYDPCAPGSRFGVLAQDLPQQLPAGIEGFHCHCHCESDASALEHTLEHLEAKFGPWMSQIKWLNLGGGHLMTRAGYDVQHLIRIIQGLRSRYPGIRVILEPGSAFAWQTGSLVSSVVDIVSNHGIQTAILDVSFTCHMPDCLEMPYQPVVRGAQMLSPDNEPQGKANVYRLGGNSCLSGDFMGYWQFPVPLQVGQQIIFEDMIHYTTVKTTMFNGIHHPSLVIEHPDGNQEILRQFTYEDYRDRMD